MLLPEVTTAAAGVVEQVALVDTTRLLAGGGEGAGLAVLVDRVGDPVDAGVAADGRVRGVDEDDLEVLVGRVLVNPVRVKDTEVAAAAADLLLGNGAVGALVLQLVNTLVRGLAVGGTLVRVALAATAADTAAVDDVALLGLVAETAGLVGTRRVARAVDGGELAVLPAADTEEETEDVRLLVAGNLFKVFVGTHGCVLVLVVGKDQVVMKFSG